MKCPHCNYVSFDGLPRCKKCGFTFTSSRSQQVPLDIASLVSDTSVKEGERRESGADDALKKTVSSIRESLAQIDGTSGRESDAVSEGSLDVDTDDLTFRADSNYMDTLRRFPDNSEINWEESVSLSSDNVTFPFTDDNSSVSETDRDMISQERTVTREGHFQGTLRKIREELKEIDEGRHETQAARKAVTQEPLLFKPPAAGMAVGEDGCIARVGRGGFWIRTLAYLVDSVILEFLSLILIAVGMLAMSISPSGLEALDEERIVGLIGPYYLFRTIITILYFTYFHGSVGQTPGKMLCGLKVVRITGETLGYSRALLRWAGYLPSSLVLGLGFLWIAWDKNKQAWHDKIAGTLVIRC